MTFAKSDSGLIMNAHEFVDCELEFDLNNSYIPIKEEFTSMPQ